MAEHKVDDEACEVKPNEQNAQESESRNEKVLSVRDGSYRSDNDWHSGSTSAPSVKTYSTDQVKDRYPKLLPGKKAIEGRRFRHEVNTSLGIRVGSCSLSYAVALLGLLIESYKTTWEPKEDAMLYSNSKSIFDRIRRQQCSGGWLGLNCAS